MFALVTTKVQPTGQLTNLVTEIWTDTYLALQPILTHYVHFPAK
jgi:hypothetical protein